MAAGRLGADQVGVPASPFGTERAEPASRRDTIGFLVNATGWFPDDILDRLTWADVADLSDYWMEHPPLQAMVQAYLGIGSKPNAQKLGDDDLMRFAQTGQLPT